MAASCCNMLCCDVAQSKCNLAGLGYCGSCTTDAEHITKLQPSHTRLHLVELPAPTHPPTHPHPCTLTVPKYTTPRGTHKQALVLMAFNTNMMFSVTAARPAAALRCCLTASDAWGLPPPSPAPAAAAGPAGSSARFHDPRAACRSRQHMRGTGQRAMATAVDWLPWRCSLVVAAAAAHTDVVLLLQPS